MIESADSSRARWVRFERAPRLPGWSRGTVLVILLWAGLVGLHEWLVAPRAPEGHTACLVRAVTGVPCPTCGSTRSVLAAAQGDLAGAFLANPFVFVVGIGLVALAILRFGFARRVDLHLPTVTRRLAWTIVIVLFLGNWAYIIARDGPFHLAPTTASQHGGVVDVNAPPRSNG